MAGVGAFFGWFVKDIKGYFKGENTIPWTISGISNFMGLFSTFVFVAYAGVAYEDGIVGVTVLWCTVFPCLFAAFYIGKRWLRSGIITPVEYLETRFNIGVRQFFSWTGLGVRFLDNMVRLYAIGIFLVAATPLSFPEAIIYSGIVITLFTIIGGVWAVVVIDTLQFIILVFSSIILIPLTMEAVGGLNNLMNNHPSHFDWFNGPKGAPLWLMVYYVMILLKYNANWVFIQRFYSVKDEKSVTRLGLLSAFLFFVFPIVFLFPAIAAVDILPNLPDPEMAYVAVATKLLPAGLMGIMLAAMFSATMSSLNSEFNIMSGVLTNDIYKRLMNPNAGEKQLVWVARLNVLIIGMIVIMGAFFVGQLGGAFEANKILTGLFSIPMAVPLVFGIILKKPNATGAWLAIVIGILSGLILTILVPISWELATLIQILICFSVFFISGYLFSPKKEYQKRVNEFFSKVTTRLKREEISKADPKFKNSLANLFFVAIGLSGILFLVLSLPSIEKLSGILAFSMGGFCMVLAVGIKLYFTRSLRLK